MEAGEFEYVGFWPWVGASVIDTVLVALVCAPLFMGLGWVAFDRRKQGWHDKLAGTVVVRKRK